MTPLQQKEFQLLKKFIDICDYLNLTYYLVCGSCLGAVKYQGFIPWDDDVDVALPRDDYEIFIEKASQYLEDNQFLQNYHTEPDFPIIFTKLRDSSTTFIEKTAANLDINHGIYIDIFPLDGYPKNKAKSLILEIKKKIYTNILWSNFDIPENKKLTLIHCLELDKKTNVYLERYIHLISSYSVKKSDLICNHGNWQGKLEYAPKEQYGLGTIANFEGLEVRIPERYDEYLTQKYGDWRSDLPESDKKGHHTYTVCDCENPYTIYRGGEDNE